MTRVLARFRLQRPPAEAELAGLAELRGVYGILDFELEESGSALGVEYDATRLRPAEVASLLRSRGIPAVPA